MTISRHELNEAEARFLWAVAHFGGDESLLCGLDKRAQAVLTPKLAALARMEAAERAELADEWARMDAVARRKQRETGWGGGELWQGAADFSVQKLSQLPAQDLLASMLQVGLFQFAVVVREQDRRRMIRTRRELGEGLMTFLDQYLALGRVVSSEEGVRIREVLIVLSRRYERIDVQLGHLGMYFVACAAGARFRRQSERIAKTLGGDLGQAFGWYYMRSLKRGREELWEIARLALEALSSVHHAKEGSHG